jgi:DDE superfamily endonuclease
LLFLDESGFYLLPAVMRTSAPVGETPILHPTLSHDHLSVIGAVGLHERLYFQVYEQAISSAEVIRFLAHLRRLIPGSRSTGATPSGSISATARPSGSTWSASLAMPRSWTRRKASGGT